MRGRSRKAWRTGDIRIASYAPLTMFPGFDLADWRIAAQADFPALAAKVGQQWRDPADTYDTATHFRFPDGNRFIKGATWTSSGGATVYPLADDGTVASAAGFGHLPMTAPGYQTFTYVQMGAANVTLLGLPANPLAVLLPRPSAAPVGWQHRITAFDEPAIDGNHDAGGPVIAVLNASNAVVGFAGIAIYKNGPTLYCNLSVNGITVIPDAALTGATVGKSSGFYVNTDGSIGWTAAGVDRGTVPGLSVGATDHFYFGTVVNDRPGYSAGLSMSAELLSATSDLTEPFPVGTIGAGNALSPLVVASSVGTRAGSATSGAHALTVAELPAHDHAAAVGQGGGGGLSPTMSITGDGTSTATGNVRTGSTGEGDAHSHTINPEHATMLVLVKL